MADLNSNSQVRVGVRIRPLTLKETGEGGKVVLNVNAFDRTVTLSKRKFTYDSVFHSNVTQLDLYSSVAPPLLDSFLNGYNATVLAYGQTGSGKTYTMGSEAGAIDEASFMNGNVSDNNIGLIPRFISDMFESLFRRREASEKASLRKNNAPQQSVALVDFRVSASFLEVYGEDIFDLLNENRKALKIREDSNKEVVVVGLKQARINNAVDAMNVLNTGTMNRTTAETLMNFTSSRSHACFTVNLQQTTRGTDGDDVTTTSRFTFVDLAGSERMKKTGAEGTRAKEGIKINEGLLALGNVINALADEDRLSKGERVHVPYRQSKLTRLLQDALGGNSQTLFLACVSPSDTNASETLSTLHYANRARNIKNAPTRNIDATAEELRRLRTLTHLLKNELIRHRFGCESATNSEGDAIADERRNIGRVNDDLMERDDVIEYLKQIEEKASEIRYTSERTLPQSVLDAPQMLRLTSAETSTNNDDNNNEEEDAGSYASDAGDNIDSGMQGNETVLPDDQQDEQIRKIEGDIEEQEVRLVQLKERILRHHDIQEKYIVLTNEVQKLEIEKQDLQDKLEKAQGEGTTWIKAKLEQVQALLARARQDIRKEQQKCREAEMDAQRCKGLENRIEELKSAKANLLKKQKDDAKKQRDYSKTKARELQDATRRERSAQKTVLKLEAENQRMKAAVERSKTRNVKLSNKLKDVEASLKQALATKRSNSVHSPHEDVEEAISPTSRTIDSIKYVLDKTVTDRVALSQTRTVLKSKVALQQSLLQSIAAEANILAELERREQSMSSEPSNETLTEITYHKDNVQDLSIQLELLEISIDELRAKFPSLKDEINGGKTAMDNVFNERDSVMKVISKLHFRDLRALVLSFLSSSYSSELDRHELKSALTARDLKIATLENEVATKNEKINLLTRSLGRRRESEEFHQSDEASMKIKSFVGVRPNGSPFPSRQAANGTNGPADVASTLPLSSPAAITPSSTRATKFESLKQRYLKKVQSPKITEEDIPMPQIHKYNLRKTNNR